MYYPGGRVPPGTSGQLFRRLRARLTWDLRHW
jgi:hypothetical protein